jgi:hypothetical protein
VPFCGPTGDVHHLDVRFVAVARNGARHSTSDESLDVRWWPVESLGDMAELEPELVELVELSRERAQSSAPSSRAPAE